MFGIGLNVGGARALAVALGFGSTFALACGGRSARLDEQAAAGGSPSNGGTQSDAGESSTGGAGTSTGGSVSRGGAPSTGGRAGTTGGTSVGGTSVGGSSLGGASLGGSSMCGDETGETAQPPECRGIRVNQPCAFEGLECSDLPCGLADAGRRDCVCATNWSCTACDHPGGGLPPEPIVPCPSEVADEVSCSSEGALCGPLATGEYCACYVGPSCSLIWDCDYLPACWPACGF